MRFFHKIQILRALRFKASYAFLKRPCSLRCKHKIPCSKSHTIRTWFSSALLWYLIILSGFMLIHQIHHVQWRHNERDGVSNHRRLDCLPDRLFRHRSKKISKLRVTGFCEGNPPVTGGFPSQRTSEAENVSTWWRHHAKPHPCLPQYLSLKMLKFTIMTRARMIITCLTLKQDVVK